MNLSRSELFDGTAKRELVMLSKIEAMENKDKDSVFLKYDGVL